MSTRQLLEAFDRWSAVGVPLALATVVETAGSTYTKPGHRILITGAGEYQGLVSGGCLEGDLAEHARAVLASRVAQVITYDLRGDQDEIWGMGIGCEGLFRVLLQPLLPESGHEPFRQIAACLRGERECAAAVVVDSADPGVKPGATVIVAADQATAWGLDGAWRERLAAACRGGGAAPATMISETIGDRTLRAVRAPLSPLPWLLVLGAGPDAAPLVTMARQLGWRTLVTDHRPAYVARGDLAAADELRSVAAGELPAAIALERFTAALVMSHHLASDRDYLRHLAFSPVPYVGLLGPAARRDRLLADIGPAAAALRPRLHAPVGLDIGADSPESIALAILAEMHALFQRRAGVATGAAA